MHHTSDNFPVKKYLEEIRILEVKTQMKPSGLPPITKTSGKKALGNLSKIDTNVYLILYFKTFI